MIVLPSEDFAELIGIVLGDGSLQSFVKPGKGVATYSLRIACHSNEKKYLLEYVKPLCERVLDMKANVVKVKGKNCLQITVYGKRVVKTFAQHGIRPGNKITNQSSIPEWVFTNDNWLRACVRGLIDTDGSIYRIRPGVQICFRNHNHTLLKQTRQALLQLGLYVSKISCNKIYITRKADIQKFFKEISFSNYKHRERYRRFRAP